MEFRSDGDADRLSTGLLGSRDDQDSIREVGRELREIDSVGVHAEGLKSSSASISEEAATFLVCQRTKVTFSSRNVLTFELDVEHLS